ncbi:uncharacterized protein ATC70_006747 [Mucor velutinosus]|uniref:Uncharacterized protein n=1 Tax=Mucor velutinosus TaxID=708070 RepID=A0AAN7I4C2_9FUNG|nr:hypothetical protein ATC70_006747 [Mucor velutinosus]
MMASGIAHPQQQQHPHQQQQQQQQQPSSNTGISFKDAFWDDQSKGVEILSNRLRKSKDTCEELKKLYQLRASIEQDYGERLLKLAQTSRIGELEEHSFAETLSRIPSALETTARAHIDLAQQLQDHLEVPLDGFLKDQRDVRKMQQQHIENSKQLKNLHEADVARAKEYCLSEYNKLKSMEAYRFELGNGSTEDIAKIEKEIDEQKRMVAVADQVYKRSVDNFNAVNDKWVNDWSATADVYQEMEVKRISYLRSTLWSFANMMTITFSIDEECCDRIRTALEITDVQKDVTAFVQRYGTGNRIPAPMQYEMLYDASHIQTTMPTSAATVTSAPIMPGVAAAAPAIIGTMATTSTYSDLDQPLSAPLPQTTSSADSLPDAIPRETSESTAAAKKLPPHPPVTILTNPDEELKSVDRQLRQLEVQNTTPQSEHENHQFNIITSPQQLTSGDVDEKREVPEKEQQQPPLSGATNTTDQSNGPVSTAMKEVEQILNQKNSSHDAVATSAAVIEAATNNKRESYASSSHTSNGPKQSLPPIMMARPIPPAAPAAGEKLSPTTSNRPISDDFSGSIYNALGMKEERATSQYDLQKEQLDSVAKSNSAVELAPLSSETPILMPFDTLATRNESMISNGSSKDLNQKYKPMPNPVYNSNGAIFTTRDIPPSQDEMNHAAPETVPNMKPVVGVRTSSLLLSQKPPSSQNGSRASSLNREMINKNDDDDDYEENEDEKEYHNRMPRPPPKDEKWVISSIRRPQQLPVRAMNARMFDGSTSSRNSMASPTPPPIASASLAEHSSAADLNTSPAAAEADHVEDDVHRHPKPHRPTVPLTIDIPNSVKPASDVAQNAAQQVIADGKRRSQMSPVQQKMDLHQQQQSQPQTMDRNVIRGYINNQQNGIEEGGIRPAPWQEEFSADDHRVMRAPLPSNGSGYYGNGHASYQLGMPGPRSSSIKLSEQQQQQQQMLIQQQQQQHNFEEDTKKRFGKNAKQFNGESSVKSKEKENKTGRFSLGFFGGGKKEKKKEKEKEKEKESAAAAAAAMYTQQPPDPSYMQQQQQNQPYMQQQPRPLSQQHMYQKQPSLHELSQSDLKSNHSGQQQQTSQPQQQQATQQQLSPPQLVKAPFSADRFIGFAKAQWPFEATIDGEMSFQADEVVGIIHKQMDGWWEAERLGPVGAGQRGLVPGNYMLDNQPPPPSLQQQQ